MLVPAEDDYLAICEHTKPGDVIERLRPPISFVFSRYVARWSRACPTCLATNNLEVVEVAQLARAEGSCSVSSS